MGDSKQIKQRYNRHKSPEEGCSRNGDICGTLEPRGRDQSSWVCCRRRHEAFVTRQAMCWEADTHRPKKGSPRILCRKALSSVTLGYFQPHLHTGITTVSTVSSLTTKDNSDKSQGSLNWKIALLTTVDARFSIVNRASQVIYAATTCIRSPPSFSCFPGTCQNESETVVSSNMSYIA